MLRNHSKFESFRQPVNGIQSPKTCPQFPYWQIDILGTTLNCHFYLKIGKKNLKIKLFENPSSQGVINAWLASQLYLSQVFGLASRISKCLTKSNFS